MTFSGENKMILLRSSNTTAIVFGNFFNSNRLWHCGLQAAAIVFGTLVFSRSKTNVFDTSAFSRQQSSLASWPPAECNRLRHSGIQLASLSISLALYSELPPRSTWRASASLYTASISFTIHSEHQPALYLRSMSSFSLY